MMSRSLPAICALWGGLLVGVAMAQEDADTLILPGVPRVGFDVHLSPFPGSLCSVLEYVGDPIDYDYLMGVTGACFRRFFNKDDGGNIDLMYLAPEPYERIGRALGYQFEMVGYDDRGAMIAALKQSLAAGRPVFGFGIIGPPECGVITGYAADGEILHGWSYFQEPDLPGYYERRDWFENAAWVPGLGFLIMRGDGKQRAHAREVLLSSLKWAVELERGGVGNAARQRRDHVTGLDAYEAWAAALEVDADYPLDTPDVLATRLMVHGDQCVMLEERHNAARFLREMTEHAPEVADELGAAADLYDQTADEMKRIWLWGFDMGPQTAKALAQPETRKGIAAAVRAARATEERAVQRLERALDLMR